MFSAAKSVNSSSDSLRKPPVSNQDMSIPRTRIQSLPVEMLRKIFLQIVTDAFEQPTAFSEGSLTRCPPWNLSAVCRDWRGVCLDNPSLWVYIVIAWHSCSDIELNDNTSFFRLCIQINRTKNLPLHVNADFSCCVSAGDYLGVVAYQCHRWKSLYFHNPLDQVMLQDILPSPANAPLLKNIHWDEGRMPMSLGDQDVLPFTELASLRLMTITTYPAPSHLDPTIPWNQLTRLHLPAFDDDLGDLLLCLSACTKLEEFSFSSSYDRRDDPLNSVEGHEIDSVLLPNLANLDVCFTQGGGHMIMPYIRTPNLRHLGYDDLSASAISVITSLIERSSCTLSSFTASLTEESEGLESLFRLLPGINSLALHDAHALGNNCNSVLHTLLGMNEQSESEIYCPRLEHLELVGLGLDPALLLQFMDSREDSDSVAPIGRLGIKFSGLPALSKCYVLEERLQKQKMRGLVLQLSYSKDGEASKSDVVL